MVEVMITRGWVIDQIVQRERERERSHIRCGPRSGKSIGREAFASAGKERGRRREAGEEGDGEGASRRPQQQQQASKESSKMDCTSFQTAGYHAYSCKFSPFHPNLIALIGNTNFGINGKWICWMHDISCWLMHQPVGWEYNHGSCCVIASHFSCSPSRRGILFTCQLPFIRWEWFVWILCFCMFSQPACA